MRALIRLLLDVVIIAIALWVVTLLVPGVDILPPTGVIYADGQYDHTLVFLGVAAVFVVLNAVVKPILDVLGAPITCLTLGLFALVINALIFLLAGWISQQLGLGLVIEGFWAALIGAAVMSIASWLMNTITGIVGLDRR